MALYQQKLRFCWAGLVSATSCEPRHPCPGGTCYPERSSAFPSVNILHLKEFFHMGIPCSSSRSPSFFYWETKNLSQIFQEKLIWINRFRSACHIHQTLGVFLDPLKPRVSGSKDISDPGYALLFSMLKAWWKLSVLIMTLEGYWEIFSPTKC